jgi:hypothetical protein
MPIEKWSPSSTVLLRVALGATFLTAVTDRFGVWGAPGAPQVAWGANHVRALFTSVGNEADRVGPM